MRNAKFWTNKTSNQNIEWFTIAILHNSLENIFFQNNGQDSKMGNPPPRMCPVRVESRYGWVRLGM